MVRNLLLSREVIGDAGASARKRRVSGLWSTVDKEVVRNEWHDMNDTSKM